jgi:hypothetical protein
MSSDHEFANGLVTIVAQEQFVRQPQRDAPSRASARRRNPALHLSKMLRANPYVERRNARSARLSY